MKIIKQSPYPIGGNNFETPRFKSDEAINNDDNFQVVIDTYEDNLDSILNSNTSSAAVNKKKKTSSDAVQKKKKIIILDDEEYHNEENEIKEEENSPNNKIKLKNKNKTSTAKENNKKKSVLLDDDDDLSYEEKDVKEEEMSPKSHNSRKTIDGLESLKLNHNPQNGLPEFLKADNIRDKMRRRPEHIDYDPTSLYVPESYIKSKECTPVMQQYWAFKIDNFDKVLLFKLGKFYEMFYDDAIVGNQILDLNWMGNDPKKLHVGFPERCLDDKAAKLIESGFKVAVVEQIETPDELKERNKSSGSKDKCVKRELCNVLTKGTYINPNNNAQLTYSNKFCISLVCTCNPMSSIDENSPKYLFGFSLFDVTTLQFYFGQVFEKDENFKNILTLIYKVKPEEFIIVRNNFPSYLLRFIQSLSTKPVLSFIKNDYNLLLLNKKCINYFGEDLSKWDPTILKYISQEDNNRNVCCSLFNSINYLEKILLAEQFLPIAIFSDYSDLRNSNNLILDYQAVSNLELIETKIDSKNCESGSLIEYMNRCVTQFGKRMMRSWILSPLANVEEINSRLDMVDDFIHNPQLLKNLRTGLSKWPDIERQCSKIYKFAINNKSKAVYFEDVSKNRLEEFFNLVNFLRKSTEIFRLFDPYVTLIKSKLINKLILNDGSRSNVPNIKNELENFTKNFIIKNHLDENKNNIISIEPLEGIYEDYDNYKAEICKIEEKFNEIIDIQRKKLNCAIIKFAHTKNYKYELEIPEEYVNGPKRPAEYKLTTSKKGYLRFHTPEIENLIVKLDSTLDKIKDENKKFNYSLFTEFYSKSASINQYIRNMAELDCLANLAIVSTESEGIMTRPQFIPPREGLPYLSLTKSRHPCLSSRSSNFIPNNIQIGDNNKTSIVITGPNMGGKSTILRQTCICVIMAQLGCYVPADKCVLTPVDRIFTRIGARDK